MFNRNSTRNLIITYTNTMFIPKNCFLYEERLIEK